MEFTPCPICEKLYIRASRQEIILNLIRQRFVSMLIAINRHRNTLGNSSQKIKLFHANIIIDNGDGILRHAINLSISNIRFQLHSIHLAILVCFWERRLKSLKQFASATPLLKATDDQEYKETTLKKAADVKQKLRDKELKSAAELYRKGVAETLTYLDFSHEHWRNIRTN